MPRSKTRKKHGHHHTTSNQTHPAPSKPRRRAAVGMAYFGALLGIIIALASSDWSIPWIFAGAAAGAIAGYFGGRLIDNAVSNRK